MLEYLLSVDLGYHYMHRFHLTQILKGRHRQPPMDHGSENEEQMEAEMAHFMANFKMQAGSTGIPVNS